MFNQRADKYHLPVLFAYKSFSWTDEHKKIRAVFALDRVITDAVIAQSMRYRNPCPPSSGRAHCVSLERGFNPRTPVGAMPLTFCPRFASVKTHTPIVAVILRCFWEVSASSFSLLFFWWFFEGRWMRWLRTRILYIDRWKMRFAVIYINTENAKNHRQHITFIKRNSSK